MHPRLHRSGHLTVRETRRRHIAVQRLPVNGDRSHPHREFVDGIIRQRILAVNLQNHAWRHQLTKRSRRIMKIAHISDRPRHDKTMFKNLHACFLVERHGVTLQHSIRNCVDPTVLPVQIIALKRDGCELSDQLIADFIGNYASDQIPDYQMAAFAMAVFLNGMTPAETAALTQAMLDSGQRLQWPDDGIPCVDKHSTGGVGDKISLAMAPLLAACGVRVPMLSGRGLGPTGGTLDKLESISGFRTDLSLEEIHRTVLQTGCVITGASAELAPADRRLYALRDVTATVPSIPLITASILSKKLAESPDALVLDVKYGSGAFMKTREQARQLAKSLVDTGTRMNVPITAILTSMNQPLGRMCGNALEVEESINVLRGEGPEEVRELTILLTAELLTLAGIESEPDQATALATRRLDEGAAMEVFERMVAAQNGQLDAPRPTAPVTDIQSDQPGVVTSIDVEAIGYAIVAMGGGRKILSDSVDHSVGIEMLVKIGEQVDSGQPLMRLFSDNPTPFADQLQAAVVLGADADADPLIADRITGNIS